MPTVLTHDNYETIASLLTSELDSLANSAYSAASAAQGSDSVGGPLFGDFELVLASLNPTDNAPLAELYIVRSADGTNYEDAPSATNPASNNLAGVFVGDYGTSAKRAVIPDVPLPPGLWKAYVKNVCGVNFAASNNTLKCRAHNLLST